MDEIVKSENLDVTIVVTPSNDKIVENKGVSNTVESNAVRMNNTSAPIIEDWNSDNESKIDYTIRPSIEKIKFVKIVRETDDPKQNKHHPRGNQRNWNNLMSQRLGSDFKMTNKACYVCGSFEHLHYVCDKKVIRQVWNNSRRVNNKNFTNKITHPYSKRSFVPQAVLTKSGKLSTAGAAVNTVKTVNTANTKAVNTVRSVNTAASKPIVNHPRTKTNAFKRGYSQSSRPFNRHFANKNSIINTNVNTARVKHTTARDRAVVSENKGKGANVVKASACWGNPQQKEYKEKAVIDSGCSRHMTGNKCYLDEYEDYDGGFVSFGDGKGRISGKGKIKTGSLDFDDNGVAERKNRTLIEAVRTMLVDSKLPTTFWAEAVNTTCYVLNRVLVIKPHNKTPYELIHGRPPLIDLMKPFRDHLGKFDGKADEGYFVGYSVLFDVESLSISMNYVPVAARKKTIGIAGTKDNIVAGLKDYEGDARMKPTEVDENEALDKSRKHDQEVRSESERLNQKEMQTEHTNSSNDINIVTTPVSTVGPSFDIVVPSTLVNTVGPSVSTDNESEEKLFDDFLLSKMHLSFHLFQIYL
ncbi:ribonuclease H-like domain-containing protein [Tanacetum coccineum]|uniref:Ribonuclease H-like domain-containing protein n=1 Tax=Tanacetum coccineum TaxID=301880 RepID=A0ABQ5HSM2_9ASTR